MAKYTIDLDTFEVRVLNGDGKTLPADMQATIMNLVTAVACGDLIVVQCTEADSDIPVFLLCAFLSSSKYKNLQPTGDRLIPLCELTHPHDIMECVRPPSNVPRHAFVIPLDDFKTLRAFQGSSYSPLVDEVLEDNASNAQTSSEDHSKQTKH